MADKKSILVRIPPELWEDLNVWARDELRSLNGQIEFVLREAVRRRRGGREPPSAPSAYSALDKPDERESVQSDA